MIIDNLEIFENISMAQLTTFAIGGPARYLAKPQSVEELRQVLEIAKKRNWEIYPLGGGSNLLVADSGFAGLVLQPAFKDLTFTEQSDGSVFVKAQAGVVWDDLVAATVAKDLAGLECLSAIPGHVGASPVQNIGAYGQEAANTIVCVEVCDRNNGQISEIAARDCQFDYRTSRFKKDWRGRYIITAVTYKLTPHGTATLRYGDLTKYFAERGQTSTPSLAEVRQAVLEVRRRKSMTLSQDDPNRRCAGSFYLNPIVSEELAKSLQAQYPEMPIYPAHPGYLKLSAAWLVEHAGFPKGYRRGQAGLSSKHVLAVINAQNAQASEIMALSEEITQKVFATFAVQLIPEPNLLGF